jgi:bifunctional ADP-heptose synthase (sugar kinase/adenylyltransferase)
MSSLDVLIIGDAILDDYQHCTAIGKSSKDPTLALKYQSHDLFAGGVLAVANHVANFANRVTLVSVLGDQDSQEKFIRSQLQPNIEPHFAFKKGAPTTVKRRFIDSYSLNKLFEVYVMDDSGLPRAQDQELDRDLQEHLARCDLVIAADFGHGTISPEMVKSLGRQAPFLAVNTQANAGNRGFHTISRYHQSDYVSIAGHELRLEMRDLKSELRPLMHQLQERLGCSKLVVTHGRHGCAVCDDQGEFVKVPSFAQNIVDRVGAGDALLSVTSLAAFLNVSNELLGFIGNVVGSLAVTFLGNRKPIDKLSVKKYIVSLMK